MTYAEWNDAIAGRFFNASNSGKKVFLAIERELLAEIGGHATATEEFVAAIKCSPDGTPKDSSLICRLAQRCRSNWRHSGSQSHPPYIAYLALFVLAASTEGEYQNEGFQKRFHRLLGEEISSNPPRGFYDMWELWEDLEIWANDDQQGNLGTFSCPLAGAKPYVDQPCSQIVLTEDERRRLSEIFALNDLDSASPPAGEALAAMVVRSGKGRLQPKTLRRLLRSGAVDEDLRASTIEALLDELRDWNGTIEEHGERNEFHTLRLHLRIIDRLSGRATSQLIAKDSESFETDRLLLETELPKRTYSLGGFGNGWSGGLETVDGELVDASSIPWTNGLRLSTDSFIFRFPARRVRVFKDGEFDGVPGLLETNRLDPHREFYVAMENSAKAVIDQWGTKAAEGWREITLRTGLPNGWSLFFGKRANPAVAAPPEFTVLRSDSQIRILFSGGIKIRPAGRKYFDFAPPVVRIEGLSPSMKLLINDEERLAEAGDMVLSFDLRELPSQISVKVVENGQHKCGATFQTVSTKDLAWREHSLAFASSQLGKQIGDAMPSLMGTIVRGFNAPALALAPNRPAHLIGAKAGQIVSVPSEPLPTQWQPVWIVEHGKGKRRAIFCGVDPSSCTPGIDGIGERRRIREWKQVLWYDRKNLIGPSRGEAAALWVQFRRVAENVKS